MNWLVDTCVISEIIKPRPDPNVTQWLLSVPQSCLYLSVVTVGEIQRGITRLGRTRRSKVLQEWLDNDLRQRFEGRILDVTRQIVATWGFFSGSSERTGHTFPAFDMLIAATAFVHGMTVVTRNVVHMPSEVGVFNPFSDAGA